MSCQSSLAEWTTAIRTHLPLLRKPQATVLALWSWGMVLARSCALTAVAVLLAGWLHRKEQHGAATAAGVVRRGRGETRRPTASPCRGGLFCAAAALGVGRLARHPTGSWPAMPPPWAPASRWWAISVVSRGGAIPVAWTILPAHQPHAWRREWLRLLRHLRPAIPHGRTVIVLADRGLYAGWRFRRIVRLGWHPFLRINRGGTFRPDPQATDRPLRGFVPQPGTRWRGTGTAFKSPQRRLRCTRLACWEAGYTEPLADPDRCARPRPASRVVWPAGLDRAGFKGTKRAGWPWQRTRMTQPDRAARLWLAVAVATLWRLSVGGVAEETIPASHAARGDRRPGRPAAPAASDPPARGQYLSPRLDHDRGRPAPTGPPAAGHLSPRALAQGTRARGQRGYA